MRNLTHFIFILSCFCLSVMLHAQDRDDSKYLSGAVPEVGGKVVFTKEFNIPSMSQDEVYGRIYSWMDVRLKKNENNSRIVFSDKAKGQIIGYGEEWIVFSSSALSLDRTQITYQLTVICQSEKCVLQIEKIRFSYREGAERYTAEEWVTDQYALNKTRTKLVRGLAKWRRKTVDFADALVQGVTEALSAATVQKITEGKKKEQKMDKSGSIVITSKEQVTVNVPETCETVITQKISGYRQVAPEDLSADAIRTGEGRLVIVIGDDPFNMTMMTAKSGGSLGKVKGKSVVFSILSPDQPYEQIEKAETYTVRFYPMGQTEPTLILECRKIPSLTAMEGMPRTYVAEIMKATVK